MRETRHPQLALDKSSPRYIYVSVVPICGHD